MMTSRHSVLNEIKNEIGAKMYLEFAVHLLEYGFFNPIVFSHDGYCFDKRRFVQVEIGFLNLLSFLYSCGVILETRSTRPNDLEATLYRNIIEDEDLLGIIRCYELLEADFTNFNLYEASIPESCKDGDFFLVKTYLLLRSGAALSRKAIENTGKKKLSDAEMRSLREQLENITGRKIIKRKDNSYEMR